jgi:hypothetical protein
MRCKKRFLSVLAWAAMGCASNGAYAASETAAEAVQTPAELPAAEQFRLARAYYTGEGVTQDHSRAREMFASLAERGMAQAQYLYAYMLLFGQGGERNPEEGMSQLRLAVVGRNAAATALLGDLYRRGQEVPQDNRKAAQFYRIAADQGHAAAQYALAALYNRGSGVAEDPAEAAMWFSRAAAQGFAPAMRSLAALYFNGRGVTRDPARAYAWLELAQRNLPEGSSGHEAVIQIRDRLEARLNPEDLDEANVFVEGWTANTE